MNANLILAKQLIYDPLNFDLTNFKEEAESKEYSASTFSLNQNFIKFRTAKITPTKIGAFVTLWKRDKTGITCPHDDSDIFDFYVISVSNKNLIGQFIFPKSVLVKEGILSSKNKEGKRGFRVYANWDVAENKQAMKTQKWQSGYFVELNELNVERAKILYSQI